MIDTRTPINSRNISTSTHLPLSTSPTPSARSHLTNQGAALLELVKHLEEIYGCGWGQGLLEEEVEYFFPVVCGQVELAEAVELGNLWFPSSCCHF